MKYTDIVIIIDIHKLHKKLLQIINNYINHNNNITGERTK